MDVVKVGCEVGFDFGEALAADMAAVIPYVTAMFVAARVIRQYSQAAYANQKACLKLSELTDGLGTRLRDYVGEDASKLMASGDNCSDAALIKCLQDIKIAMDAALDLVKRFSSADNTGQKMKRVLFAKNYQGEFQTSGARLKELEMELQNIIILRMAREHKMQQERQDEQHEKQMDAQNMCHNVQMERFAALEDMVRCNRLDALKDRGMLEQALEGHDEVRCAVLRMHDMHVHIGKPCTDAANSGGLSVAGIKTEPWYIDDSLVHKEVRRVGHQITLTTLGAGGFGQVYKGTYNMQDVAIKEVRSMDAASVEEFKNEIGMMWKMSHANVIQVRGGFYPLAHGNKFDAQQKMLIVLEFAPRGSLDKYLYRNDAQNALNPHLLLSIFGGIVSGLQCIHAFETTHRDIKPQNVLLMDDWTPKISDFGFAITKSAQMAMYSRKGTSGYMAPEVWKGERYYRSCDVWSLGVMLFELVLGEPMFGGANEFAVQNAVINNDLPWDKLRSSTYAKQWPAWLIDATHACLQYDPRKRPSVAQLWSRYFAGSPNATGTQPQHPAFTKPCPEGALYMTAPVPELKSASSDETLSVRFSNVTVESDTFIPSDDWRSESKASSVTALYQTAPHLTMPILRTSEVGTAEHDIWASSPDFRSTYGPDFGRAQSDQFAGSESLLRHAPSSAQQLRLAAEHCEKRNELVSAFRFYEAAAEQGDAYAQFRAGDILLQGTHGQRENAGRALQLLHKAASSGLEPAMLQLGECYQHGYGTEISLERAESWYALAAKAKSQAGAKLLKLVRMQMAALEKLKSCNHVERKLEDVREKRELGSPKSSFGADSHIWSRRADGEEKQARRLMEHTPARHVLSADETEALFQRGVVDDLRGYHAEALAAYREAADRGYAKAQHKLGMCYNLGRCGLAKDERAAVELYRKAADQGDAAAQCSLGVCCENGRGGLFKDEHAAVAWYRKAADQGNAAAQYNLGRCIEHAIAGLTKDERAAVALYRMAAEQGHAQAQCNLGFCYEFAKGGLLQDECAAVAWYRLAADQGYASAQNSLGVFYELGKGGLVKNERMAVAWYRKAADQGYPQAQCNLGICYEFGKGELAKNNSDAIAWYRRAADQGHSSAALHIERARG
eukprot:CAMPEP_0185831920 /NCGR_PEP_ID=MMETSP1353-20130828/1777_1 /TAXON_ID=1077150 /ORGANISM="Erythrolobus australicus, Strain CCMP3124" /LENGTH=1126 /DNA_ID=CAMNT_0028530037 /DNA_START=197 /DNA_END=3577 /DNA_ORIENTATION=-